MIAYLHLLAVATACADLATVVLLGLWLIGLAAGTVYIVASYAVVWLFLSEMRRGWFH